MASETVTGLHWDGQVHGDRIICKTQAHVGQNMHILVLRFVMFRETSVML